MAYTLRLAEQENIVLSHAAVQRLLSGRDGDAALLYLFLLKENNSADPHRICRELGWDNGRLKRAETVLAGLGLISGANRTEELAPAEETPDYTGEDLSQTLETDNTFALLSREVERSLGKKLTSRDLQILLGLYDELGLPAEVIYQLVSFCIQRCCRMYGEGHRPTLRQIEKEGFIWARKGLVTLDAVSRYMKEVSRLQGKFSAMMAALGLGQRSPVPSEEEYLTRWIEWGFSPETVALAYDKTVLKCGELKWAYLNGILRRWQEKGLLTPEQVQQESKPAAARREEPAQSGKAAEDMRKYVQSLHKK